MNLEWHRVTWYSQLVAIILALVIFGLGFWLGRASGEQEGAVSPAPEQAAQAPVQNGTPVVADVTYSCDGGRAIHAIYRAHDVQLLLSDGRNMTVPQAISGSGARYANDDESFVFWNKGTTAFITEAAAPHGADLTTYANCVQAPLPE